jgi:hypothetical protein
MPRFAKALFCCVFSLLPHVAHARGGPGAALGSAIVALVYVALAPGAMLGLAIREAKWRIEARIVAALTLVACTVLLTSGSSGMLSIFAFPVMAMACMTLAVSQLFISDNDVASGPFTGTASKPASDCSKSSAPVMQNDVALAATLDQ